MEGQKMSDQSKTFGEWLDALDAHHDHLRNTEEGFVGYGHGSLVTKTGEECWRDFYDDGYSPEAALDADRECWDECADD